MEVVRSVLIPVVILFAFLYIILKLIRSIKVPGICHRRVLITGCDHGFGRMLAERLDKMGVHVYAGCLKATSCDDLANKSSDRLKAFQLDVTNEDSVREAARFVKRDLNGKALWAVVNNAGIVGSPLAFELLSKDDYKKVFDVNVFGMIDVTLKFFPLIRQGHEGRIVNMASYTGRFAPGAMPYGMSKFVVEGFTDGLSKELDCFNISVHAIEPGAFKTPIMRSCFDLVQRRWETLDQQMKDDYGKEFLDETVAMLEHAFQLSSDKFHLVLDAIVHALFAKFPKERYIVGTEAKYIFIPLSYLPNCVQIWVLDALLKLAGIPYPKPKCAVKK